MALDKPLSTLNDPALPRIDRKDTWWIEPLLTFIVFTSFVIYTTFRTFENAYYDLNDLHNLAAIPGYLSPFYSPTIKTTLMLFGKHISPAIFILPIPLLFRATCYYYRKAYYRAYFLDPAGCAVQEPFSRQNYTGERAFPFILQNMHRYAFYLAALVLIILWYDTILAFTARVGNTTHFYIGIGSIVFLVNVVLLSLYSFTCHSFRHLMGGCINCFSKDTQTKSRHGIWQRISHLNERHHVWAWASLISVALVDLYVRLVATGAIAEIGKVF